MKLFRAILPIIISVFLFYSCGSRKEIVYLQGIDELKNNIETSYTPILKSDDKLLISISSLDNTAVAPFNLFLPSGGSSTDGSVLQAYLIAKDGSIEFPQLGKLHLAGLTRLQTIELLKEKLKPFVADAVVNIELLNFKISVLGEINNPGVYPIDSERITLLDAISKAGDLTVYGIRKNILVIRETEQGVDHYRVDLTSASLFDSPVYFLQQNDVVYIEPNQAKMNSSKNSSTTGIIFSATSLLVTVIALILR